MSFPIVTPQSLHLGVIGAGTMGSGIALTALRAGTPVTVYDVSAEMLEKAHSYITGQLERKNQGALLSLLTTTQALDGLAGCNLIVEAAPEELDLKRKLFQQLEGLISPNAILATNTSTLSVTAIAAGLAHPARVAGMHFFNPAAVMPLIELVRGAETNPQVITTLQEAARLWGKTPVVAQDRPGFIVNRVARPFYGEAVRMLAEGTASHEAIDWIAQGSAGFRMGPFRLMDLIGIDINAAAMRSMYQQTWHEPRYRPHWLQEQMTLRGALGRKTGQGFYNYAKGGEPSYPPAAHPRRGSGLICLAPGDWAPGLEQALLKAGYHVQSGLPVQGLPMAAILPAGNSEGRAGMLGWWDRQLPSDVPILVQCADGTIAEAALDVEYPERLVGFDGLFLAGSSVATLTGLPRLAPAIRTAASQLIESLGATPQWIEDTPGLVAPRLVATLVNEAVFAIQEGVADPETIDLAMRLGVNYPHGPIEWGRQLGFAKILRILEHLQSEYNEDRYRPAALLRRWVRSESIDLRTPSVLPSNAKGV